VYKVNEKEDVSVCVTREEEAREIPRLILVTTPTKKNIFAHIQNREREKIAPAAIPARARKHPIFREV